MATESLSSFHVPVILSIGTGVVLGVLLTSKLIHYFLDHYAAETYSAMIGLVGGSIFAILNNVEEVLTGTIVITSMMTFIAGAAFVYFLKQEQRR